LTLLPFDFTLLLAARARATAVPNCPAIRVSNPDKLRGAEEKAYRILADKAELNGKIYIWTGSEWLDENYIRPPRAIVQQLETRFSHVMAEPAGAPAARARLRPQDDDTILHELLAIIAAFIGQHYETTQNYVTRDAIAAALLQHPKSRAIIEARYQNSDHSFEWHAGNLVDWFSGWVTIEQSQYVNDFAREKINNKWAYRPLAKEV